MDGEERTPCDGLRGRGGTDGVLGLPTVARGRGCIPEGSNRGGRRGGAAGGFGSRAVVGGSNSGAGRGPRHGAAVEQWRSAVAAPAGDATSRGSAGVTARGAAGGVGGGAAGALRRGPAGGVDGLAAGGLRRGSMGGVGGGARGSGGGAGVDWERKLGVDRVCCGSRIEHLEHEDFDENWSPREQRAWLVKQRVGFDFAFNCT